MPLTDDHLDLLANANLIPRELAERAKNVKLRGVHQRIDPPAPRFVDQKATNAQRIRVGRNCWANRACTTSTGSICRSTPPSTSRRKKSSAAICRAWPTRKPPRRRA